MSSLTTDFNVSPYFDDYDETKKFYRILFKPSMAVQARELTQLQTIAQKQIERFGSHVFKDGSIVDGCTPTTFPNLDFVRVSDTFTSNANAFATDITSDYLLVGQTSNVRAVSILSKNGLIINYPDTNRFYVKYLTTGAAGETTFANGEVINVYNINQNKLGTIDANNLVNTINVVTSNATVNAVGKGYGIRIEDGIVYQKGFFQLVEDQIITVKDYDQDVGNYVVGFDTVESIVTENNDESLNDNALGYSNENAPGAHRLKLTPTMVSKSRTDIANNDTFFTVFEFSNISGELVLNKKKTPYEELGNIFDARTYDESGDYVTKPFITETIEGSNSSIFAYQVSPGKGYIHGAQVEYLAARKVEVDKATTTLEAENQIITGNYGNFVYVKEYAGTLDFSNLITVDLYDNVGFQSITNRFSPSFTGKTKIGTAKVKAVLHDSGDAGLDNTYYRVYLTDIKMNSGKSFASDVKSIYANSTVNTYGNFYADMVLTDSKAVLNESGKSTLVFPFGKKALRRLRSVNGTVTDTNFYFRNTSNATMATDGTFSVTIPSSYTGGTDSVGYSTGILGDTLEGQFIVTVAANVSTVNISGTVSISSTNTYINTSGLNTYFAAGEFIKVYANASTTDYRRVVSVNATAMVVDANLSVTNATANFGKHYPAGYSIPLSATYPGTRQVNVTSSTTFDVSTGAASAAALASTAAVNVQYRMYRSAARQAGKDIKKNRYVKLYANAASNNAWNLGLPDVFKINAVYANAAGFSETSSDEVTSYFTFDSGQRDDMYDHGRLILKPQYVGTFTNQYITVKLDHFTANLNNGVGFFSVDSYPIDDANTANTSAIQTAQIPIYASDAGNIDLRDAVDFRAFKANTANSSTTLAGATLNPGTTNTFVSYSANYLLEPDTNFEADIEYYLGRIDLVAINSTGGLSVIQGTPAENPKIPQVDTDAMVISTAFVPPYPTLSVREAESYSRQDYAVRTRISSNRVYTMKDIGLLDKRIERLEYYTTLNQLEQKAQNIQVSDASGLNRFKNGIFADPLTSHAFGRTNDFEYKISIDDQFGYARPLFSSENVDMAFDNTTSSGVVQTGRLITRPYTHEMFIYQPFATKYRNNTQDLWSWKGSVELYPTYDMNRDETRLPNIDTTLDLTQPFVDFANIVSQATGATIFGTRWGDWRTTDVTQTVVGRVVTVNTAQSRTGSNTFMVPVSETINLGKYIADVSVQPYMKSRNIAFIARNLKPNTRIYAYFDDTAVSSSCAPAQLNTDLGATLTEIRNAATASGSPENVCKRTGAYGDPLVTDQYGTLYGIFRIPEGTFRVGDRQLQLLDSDSIITGNDAALTRASAVFTASNISVSSRNATITSVTPSFEQVSLTDARTITRIFIIPSDEPIAQTFKIDAPNQQSGVFITKTDLFFKSKDPNLGIKVLIVGTVNGIPDSTTVYGSARLDSADVNVSDDAQTATTFVFNQPIFLSSGKDYAFYVEPEGGSPEYRMWMSELGFNDVFSGAQVYTNPYTGDAFRSSNAKTWAVLPREDIKFNLYVANFTVGTGTAYFNNESDDYISYSGLALANSSIPIAVGDEVYIVNSVVNTAIVNTSITARVQTIDTTMAKLKFDSSTGGFTNSSILGIFRLPQAGNSSQANSTTLIGTATLTTVNNPPLHSIVPRFATMLPTGTTIDYSFKGTSNSAVTESVYNIVSNDVDRDMLDFERVVYSKSNENVYLAGGKSLNIKTQLTCTNKYVSPVIDTARKSALVIKNIVNNDSTNEYTRYGNAITKYVGKPVVLADGQEAEDMIVYLSAYRPNNTDVEVYIKVLNDTDGEVLDTKVWTKMENQSPSLRSSPINSIDFKEYEFRMPSTAPATGAAYKNVSNFGIVQYADSTGAIYQTFKTFMIKIVLLSDNGIYVPKIDDVRGIALMV